MLSKVEFTKKVASKIKEEREAKGISQETLALDSGLYRTYINHLESARYSPSAYVLYKIALALKIDINQLTPR